ncbi:MAG: hypothetical protein ABSE93_07650 [Terriglobia bacterium]
MSTSDYKTEAIKFLSEPANLDVALEVAELIEDVKSKFLLDFWHALKSRVSESQSELPGWSLRLAGDEELLKPSYAGLEWLPGATHEDGRYLRVRIEQDGYQIFQGICWNKKTGKDTSEKLSGAIAQIGGIRSRLRDLAGEYNTNPNDWWLGWKWLNDRKGLKDKSSLLRIREGSLTIGVADEFLQLAKGVRDSVEQVNSMLVGMNLGLIE